MIASLIGDRPNYIRATWAIADFELRGAIFFATRRLLAIGVATVAELLIKTKLSLIQFIWINRGKPEVGNGIFSIAEQELID